MLKIRRFWISSPFEVRARDRLGLSLNSTRKNSSSGFAGRRNCMTACLDQDSFGPMPPLVSNTIPTEIGNDRVARLYGGVNSLATAPQNCDLQFFYRTVTRYRDYERNYAGSTAK